MKSDRLVIVIFLLVHPIIAQQAVDSFIEFSSGTSGTIVTSSQLNSWMHGDGTWKTEVSLSVSALTFGAVTNFTSPALPGPIIVGGTVYNGTTTKCLCMRHDKFEAAVLAPSSGSHSKMCVGYWWNPGFAGASDFGFYDEVSIMAGSDFCVNSWEMNGNTSQIVKTHTQTGTSATSINLTPVGTSNTKWFWVSQLFEAGQLGKIAIYDTNLVQVGSTSTLAIGSGQTVADIHFGAHHDPGNLHAANSLYNNIIFAYDANAVFPLLPPTPNPIVLSNSVVDWQDSHVWPSITNRTLIYTNFYSTNDSATIQSGINNCPSNQVVFLNAGTYTLTNFLDVLKGVTLRGAGQTNTTLKYTGGGFQCLRIRGSGTINPPPNNSAWTNGLAPGSTNLWFTSVPNLSAGQVVILVENGDPNIVCPAGNNGQADYSGMLANANLIYQQEVQVQAVTTNMVTVFPPIYATNWLASLSPQAYWLGNNTSIKMAGIENLTLDNSGGFASYSILIQDAVNCWVKNVESIGGNLAHVYMLHSCLCEIRDSFFHGDQAYGTSSYGIYILASSSMLVENNVFWQVTGPIRYATAAGCVFGYNYILWPRYDTSPSFLNEGIKSHGGHCYLNLIEGNITPSIYWDFTHGSSSHNLAFRNRSFGRTTNETSNTFALGAMVSNRWENVAGNVFGTAGYHTNYDLPPSPPSEKSIYMLGYTNTSWLAANSDPIVASTINRHLNYDVVTPTNHGIVYGTNTYGANSSILTLSNSYYLVSAPPWWTFPAGYATNWPIAGPDVTNVGPDLVTNWSPNPAMARFALGPIAGSPPNWTGGFKIMGIGTK